MAELPTRLRVGPLTYTIVGDSLDEFYRQSIDPDDHYGYTHHSSAQILLHPDMSSQMRRIVLLHEVMHAVCFAAGATTTRKRMEEDWVTMVSPMLTEALRRNPEFVAFLLDAEDDDQPPLKTYIDEHGFVHRDVEGLAGE